MKRLLIVATFLILAPAAMAAPHSVTLSWTASTDAGVNYNVYRISGTCPATATGFTQLNASAVTTTTYTDSGMVPGKWCYYVTSTLGGAESLPSNMASAVILPSAPTAVTITSSN